MNEKYPRAFQDVGRWAKENGVTVQEARVRFAQYGILRAVSDSRQLSAKLVFKGGNALDFVWSPNRSTKDLDFSATDPLEGDELRLLLQESLSAMSRKLGTSYSIHSVKRQPPSLDATFVTYAVSVGYALTDETNLRRRIELGNTSPLVIPLDVSINEVVCEDEPVETAGVYKLRVSSCEDIVADEAPLAAPAASTQPIQTPGPARHCRDLPAAPARCGQGRGFFAAQGRGAGHRRLAVCVS